MSKHTRGPWQILPDESDKGYTRIRGTSLGYRYKIADVRHAAFGGVGKACAEETEANARLIAAAPDLLAMLERIRDDRTFRTNDNGLWPDLLAAIAKATGGKA